MARPEKIRLGDLLVQQKLISLDQLQFALEQQKRSGRKLGRVLVDNAFVTEEQISEALAKQLNIPFINLKYYNVNLETGQAPAGKPGAALPRDRAGRARRHAAGRHGRSDRPVRLRRDRAHRSSATSISRWSPKASCWKRIDRVYRRTEEITGLARELREDLGDSYVDFGALSDSVGLEEAPVVKLLQTMFDDAVPGTRLGHPHRAAGRRGCRSASASTACCTCKPRPTARSRPRWCCA